MKRIAAITALAAFGLAPAVGWACGEYDDSSASATPPSKMALAPALPASKVSATATKVTAPAPAAVKQVAAKTKNAAPGNKVVAASGK